MQFSQICPGLNKSNLSVPNLFIYHARLSNLVTKNELCFTQGWNLNGLLNNMTRALRHHCIKAETPKMSINFGSTVQYLCCIVMWYKALPLRVPQRTSLIVYKSIFPFNNICSLRHQCGQSPYLIPFHPLYAFSSSLMCSLWCGHIKD